MSGSQKKTSLQFPNNLNLEATFGAPRLPTCQPIANIYISAADAKATASTTIHEAALEPSLLSSSTTGATSKESRTLVQLVVQGLGAPFVGLLSWGSTSSWEGGSTVSATTVAAHWKDVLLLPALINASSLALLNTSSVPMRGVVIAVSVGRLAPSLSTVGSPHLVLDPSEEEAAQLQAGGCFAFFFADGAGLHRDTDSEKTDCVWSGWKALSGGYDDEELFAARSLARGRCIGRFGGG